MYASLLQLDTVNFDQNNAERLSKVYEEFTRLPELVHFPGLTLISNEFIGARRRET